MERPWIGNCQKCLYRSDDCWCACVHVCRCYYMISIAFGYSGYCYFLEEWVMRQISFLNICEWQQFCSAENKKMNTLFLCCQSVAFFLQIITIQTSFQCEQRTIFYHFAWFCFILSWLQYSLRLHLNCNLIPKEKVFVKVITMMIVWTRIKWWEGEYEEF